MRRIIPLVLSVVALSGCSLFASRPMTSQFPELPPLPPQDAASSVHVQQGSSVSDQGSYRAYEDGVIGKGKKSVLFFHASWCPICAEADAMLRTMYAAESFPITTYKIDYDTALTLRSRYAVTIQHTFVLVDERGIAVKTLYAPTEEQIKALLRS